MPVGFFMVTSYFTLIEFLEIFDPFAHLGRKIENIITAIFSNHSMGVEYWNIQKNVMDAFINVFFPELRIIEFF